MTSPGLISEAFQLDMEARQPWPSDVELYQPLEVEQVLLPDNANCLAVQAFLRMCKLNFTVVMRGNAEYMSPTGRVPFIRAGKFVIAELDQIIAFVNNKGIHLTDHLEASQKADMRAYMSLVSNVLGNAETYITWLDDEVFQRVTAPRFSFVYPWPLNKILLYLKRSEMKNRLKDLGWAKKSLEEVYQEVQNCCAALSERLDKGKYFFNERPTELDALVYGHLFTILTTLLPDNRMSAIVRDYKNLVELCQVVDKEFFDKSPSASSQDSENFEKIPNF